MVNKEFGLWPIHSRREWFAKDASLLPTSAQANGFTPFDSRLTWVIKTMDFFGTSKRRHHKVASRSQTKKLFFVTTRHLEITV